jgi:membrane protein
MTIPPPVPSGIQSGLAIVRLVLVILWRSLNRLWGRDVMLYVGGVSFFILLAVFPGLVIMVGLYGLMSDPSEAAQQAEVLARLMPSGARLMFEAELSRIAHAPLRVLSTQSGIALLIGGYASHRGFKALLAGLSFIHDDETPRGFLGFNLLALGVLVAAIALMSFLSGVFFYLRLISAAFDFTPLAGVPWLFSEWTWVSLGLTLALSLIYRFAMSSQPVAWRASLIGGGAAALLSLVMSWASAVYVDQVAELGATYGSVAAVVVFLIWLSWTVNAVFFGGALATEVELALEA